MGATKNTIDKTLTGEDFMKRKIHRYRNRHLSIRGNPRFGQRVVKAKKGKGSFVRENVNKGNYDSYSESAVA